jgi:hypothetical protein
MLLSAHDKAFGNGELSLSIVCRDGTSSIPHDGERPAYGGVARDSLGCASSLEKFCEVLRDIRGVVLGTMDETRFTTA